MKVDYKAMFEALKEELEGERTKAKELSDKFAEIETASKQILEKVSLSFSFSFPLSSFLPRSRMRVNGMELN